MTSAGGSSLRVSSVWVTADWPVEPPVDGGQPAFELDADAGLMRIELSVAAGQTVQQLLDDTLKPVAHQRISAEEIGIAVFGRRIRNQQPVFDGDRIELLGPVLADPKSDRRARVKAQREDAPGAWKKR